MYFGCSIQMNAKAPRRVNASKHALLVATVRKAARVKSNLGILLKCLRRRHLWLDDRGRQTSCILLLTPTLRSKNILYWIKYIYFYNRYKIRKTVQLKTGGLNLFYTLMYLYIFCWLRNTVVSLVFYNGMLRRYLIGKQNASPLTLLHTYMYVDWKTINLKYKTILSSHKKRHRKILMQ